ncbi:MAG: nucleotidyltransferase domain-containing protein [Candidatus Wenzhouxiangella sp. M2_3B_020]
MADALFSSTRQKMLALLFAQPGKAYTLSELIERARAGSGAVQREIVRFVDSGLVLQEGSGRPKRYRANPASPVHEELCGIARKLFGPAEVVRKALESLRDRIELALVYGSVAKGTDRADSDIDVLIVSDELLLEDVYSVLEDAEQAVGRKVNPTLYTVEEFRRRRDEGSPFLADVLAGEFIVLMGEIG